MKPASTFFLAAFAAVVTFSPAEAQQHYKLRQSTSMMGMKSETTIYVKPNRKRTEAGGYMGQPNNQVTIEQCDKQRVITLNTQKKIYYIEPFQSDEEEVIDEDTKPAAKPKTAPVTTRTGGVITSYYNITDTGERKKMYGFTARHVWTTQKIKPSPDACTMKDSLIIKTDGWYIDLPEFNCPVRYKPTQTSYGGYQKPECKDRFVTRRSGRGKLGFALIEKRTVIMGGKASSSDFTTDIETLELITGKQDSMLFEIPPGYSETKNPEDLQDKFDPGGMMKQYTDQYKEEQGKISDKEPGEKQAGTIRIGVLEPAADAALQPSQLQQRLVKDFTDAGYSTVAVSSEEDARSKQCDLILKTDVLKCKQASKIGGLLKAVKNADPNAASSFNVEAKMVLRNLGDGAIRSEETVNGKYEGKAEEATGKALDEGSRLLVKALK